MKIASYVYYLLIGISLCEIHADPQSMQNSVEETPLENNKSNANGTSKDDSGLVYQKETEDEQRLENNTESHSEVLDKLLKEDLNSNGLMSSVLSGLALFYNVLSNILLYPAFSCLLGIMTILLLLIIILVIKKLSTNKSFSAIFVIATSLYVIIYIDLFLIVYENQKITFLFFQLEKEIILISIAAFIGFVGGRYFSSKSFEEKELP